MRGRSLFAVISCLALGAGVSHAGVYNPAEQPDMPPPVPDQSARAKDAAKYRMAARYQDFLNFRAYLERLRKMPAEALLADMEFPERLRTAAAAQVDPRRVPKAWNVAQRLSLSAYYIRSNKFREAQDVLHPALAQDPEHFLVLCNLATAHQNMRPDEAIKHLEDALHNWPDWNALKQEKNKEKLALVMQLQWNDEETLKAYKEREKYHLKLLNLRRRERVKSNRDVLPDWLFGEVRFVGDGGAFEPGKLAEKERAKLPKGSVEEAIGIVKHLIVWMPSDRRLYWLLGELYSASGNLWGPTAALKVFDDLALAGFGSTINFRPEDRPRELTRRRMILMDYLKANPAPDHKEVLLGDLTPPAEPEPPPLVDWKTLSIGFAGGCIVMLFLTWQVREIRRRRQMREAAARSRRAAPPAPEPAKTPQERITSSPTSHPPSGA